MAYEPTIWKNREVERPRTFQEQSNPDGTITLIPKEGNIIEAGTPIIADTMNKMELGIKQAHDDLANLDLSGLATKQELNTHLADDASLTKKGHVQLSNATNSTSNTLAATPSAVKQAMDRANEAFLLGNSTKEQLVDTLLSLDPSLPISYNSTWQEILTATGQISTGLEIISGSSGLVNNQMVITGIPFTPKMVFLKNIIYTDTYRDTATYVAKEILNSSFNINVHINGSNGIAQNFITPTSDGFQFNGNNSAGNAQFNWAVLG